MLSKKTFIKVFDFIRKKDTQQNALIDALELCSPGEYVNAFIYSEYEQLVISLVEEALDLTDAEISIIEMWIYSLEYGEKWTPDSLLDENNKPIDISTADKLYDYLILKK